MAGTTVRIRIIGDASSLQKATRDAGDAVGRLEKVGGGLAGKLAAAFSAAAVAKFAADSVKAASSVQESMSKLNILLGDSSKQVVDWSKTTAKSIGISQVAALEALGVFANLFNSLNRGGQETARMSQEMVQLAGDMASFNNASIEDTLIAIQAGLRGEALPLRRFGVLLDDATLKERAFSMGIRETTTGVLPPTIRLQAAYAEILAQTSKQQGDYARTGHLLANQTRTLGAEFEDLKTRLGVSLYPTAQRAIAALRDGLPVFEQLAGSVMNLGVKASGAAGPIAALGATVGTFAFTTFAATKTLSGISSAVGSLTSMATTFGGAMTMMASAVTTFAAIGLVVQAKNAAEAKRTTDELAEALRLAGDPTQELTDWMSDLGDKMRGVKDAGEEAKGGVETFDDAWAGNKAERDGTLEDFNRIGVSLGEVADLARLGGDAFAIAADASTSSMKDLAAQQEDLAVSLAGADASQVAFIARLYELAETGTISGQQLQLMLGTLDGLSSAYNANSEKSAEAARRTIELAVGLGDVTQAWVDERMAAYAGRSETEKWIAVGGDFKKRMEEAGKGLEANSKAARDYALSHGDAAEQIRILRGEIDDLVESYEKEEEAILAASDAELAYEAATRRADKSTAELATKTEELAEAIRIHGADSEEAAKAQDEYAEALFDSKKSYKDAAEAIREMSVKQQIANDGTYDAVAASQLYRDKLQELRDKATDPALIAFLENLIGKLDANATSAGTAAYQMRELSGALRELKSAEQVADVFGRAGMPLDLPYSPVLAGQRASGGPVNAGATYLVGENGPELVTFGRSGTVVPTDHVGAGGGQVVNIYVQGVGRPDDVVRWLREELRRLDRGQR